MTNKYFDFLYNIIETEDSFDYLLMLQHLHRIEFYALIPNDDNRASDGLYLRETFINKRGQHALSFCPEGPCTVFEMLVGLSLRLEFETLQSEWEKTPSEWFWILLDNLGLSNINNKLYCDEGYNFIVTNVTLFLERRYKSNGKGGLFPLKKPKKDQKKVEIWYQMSAYILENYPI